MVKGVRCKSKVGEVQGLASAPQLGSLLPRTLGRRRCGVPAQGFVVFIGI